ncbi:MAG: ABC transporter substrate-binding protein, partial [Chloroflexota bacterium]
ALALALVVAACAPQSTTQSRALVYGAPNQPNTLNPITAPDIVSRSMIEMIFDGLVAADDKSQLHPELATEWQSSPDGKEWTFLLRKGVKWHDGKDFTAEDVKFTYDTVIDPNTKPTVSKADYAAIQRVEVVDPYTVRFHLSRPDAAFLSRLVLGIAPKHLLQGQDLATAAFNSQPVGTGPFTFGSWAKGESVVLKRNPTYFGTAAKVESLVWKLVPDSSMLAVQTMKGEVDGAPVASPSDVSALRSSGDVALHETLEGNTQISLQLKNPLFQDVRVRHALAHAIDTQALIDKVMLGAAVPATSDIPPTSWAYNPNVPRYQYDPTRARDLLAEAGWKPGTDGILVKDGRRFEISLMTYAGNKAQEQVMLAVRQNWADLGLEVKAGVQERNSFVSQTVLKGNFDAALLQSAVQIDPDISRRFHTNSIQKGQNFLNYSNPVVDRLLEEGLSTSDQEKRRQIYGEVQRIVAEDLPQISLFHPKTVYAFKPQIQGVKPAPTNLFWNAEEWEWK